MNVLSKEDERALFDLFTHLGSSDPEGDLAHAKAEISAALAAGRLTLKDRDGVLVVDAAEAMKLWPAHKE